MKNARHGLVHRQDFLAALGLMTRLPVTVDPDTARTRGAAAAWCFPFVGAVVGVIAAAGAGLALWVGVSPSIAAALALAILAVVTGAMHEDGLADSVDGLWGGWIKDRRLEIMKDSRIGAYGVLALILILLLRWSALSGTDAAMGWALIAAAILSRAAVVAIWFALPPARANGLSASSGQPGLPTTALAITLGIGLSMLVLNSVLIGLLCTASAALAILVWGIVAHRKIGGQTGDILGAGQQISETLVLIVLSTILS
ncbi:adenosylcobinamide-GDP ribazoletransferase [Pseudoruegeria sp. SK021]|uniref:adenosylcobinamide-GDP ribazoletransferase n=1 Tax=Pseudoruegeria sp. SK021 TaxID=1933035 RepID=UPI000A2534B9|nr:adenosylcobinamide-GDP ribazoletransferase [Pseudoruegeria sp. SK021]OSP55277.1 adenosylcobinamide-GDP ribazoletransferase [Pseudoruegeria sp. SK021]